MSGATPGSRQKLHTGFGIRPPILADGPPLRQGLVTLCAP